jgi:hypothetical protein
MDIPMERVHLNAVMASKEAAQRDRDLFRRERDRYREALEDIARASGDDPLWAIDRASQAL